MKRLERIALMLGLLASLIGCDAGMDRLQPGVSSLADVLAVMGAPSAEWREPDGATTYEFTRQPEGVVNYTATVGPDGILRALEQTLTEQRFARVAPGMTKDEIRRLLGQPAQRVPFALKQEETWSWRYQPEPGRQMWFNVNFDPSGKVVSTSRSPADTTA
ncbi:MAG: outer membrane protein assembly factor BamE [Burkholderiales bacterium]|nr:outer membrane protein assembly factor BamE [Burkholderiales bacterium]